ncbi:MAG: hypothetical protein K2K21_18230 [Lachnospiraceae bacterium]|nr:hypothetical protein [Lachnospiraceae bacterium]
MKFGRIKKLMTAVVAATMLMSATLMVCAADTVLGNGSPTASGNDLSSSTGSSNSTNTTAGSSTVVSETPKLSYVEKATKAENARISVAGTEIKTSLSGVYAAETVRGAVVETPVADVKASLGLAEGQKPTIFIYDVDSKKSVNAMASINAAADAMGTDVVACLQIELGAKENGKWVKLSDGSVALKAGLPKSADTSLTYYVICVQEGGTIIVLEDLDTDPDTVTFAVNAGLGAYAIVAK